MDRQEIYDLLNKLGMIEENYYTKIPMDLPELMCLVDDLFINNDEATIKKFLVCLLYKEEK